MLFWKTVDWRIGKKARGNKISHLGGPVGVKARPSDCRTFGVSNLQTSDTEMWNCVCSNVAWTAWWPQWARFLISFTAVLRRICHPLNTFVPVEATIRYTTVIMHWYMYLPLRTHTHTQPLYCSSGICLGPPRWAGTRKVKPGRLKPIWIYWSKR